MSRPTLDPSCALSCRFGQVLGDRDGEDGADLCLEMSTASLTPPTPLDPRVCLEAAAALRQTLEVARRRAHSVV